MAEVKWREVTADEYASTSVDDALHRFTFGSSTGDSVYELGTAPIKAPTGGYALVVPAPYVERDDYYGYIGLDETWYRFDPETPGDYMDAEATSDVERLLNNTGAEGNRPTHVIAFEGIQNNN